MMRYKNGKGYAQKDRTNPDGQGTRIPGFTLTFIYGDYPQAFQYKIKFKSDGWPIGI